MQSSEREELKDSHLTSEQVKDKAPIECKKGDNKMKSN
jgi:hypothetical protein